MGGIGRGGGFTGFLFFAPRENQRKKKKKPPPPPPIGSPSLENRETRIVK